MANAILALNAGSSSIKFAVHRAGDERALLYKGLLDKHASETHFVIKDAAGKIISDQTPRLDDKQDLTQALLQQLEPILGEDKLVAVGHRVVHGGPRFFDPVIVQPDVLDALDALTPLAPLHQPGCLAPIKSLMHARPDLPQVACFDTAFHRDLAAIYQRFPLPDMDDGIHRYGFHGLSFEHIAGRIDNPKLRVVVAHLGSGCSLCALHDGKSVNTTMSLTPLDGLMMATRSGAVDPGLLLYLQRSKGYSVADLEDLLYHKSGLLGVSGVSADMRTLLASQDADAAQAIAQFCARAAEQIAVMATSLGGLDLLVFTGGVGENSAPIRAQICQRLQWLGIAIDAAANDAHAETISSSRSSIAVRIIPTDEEAEIVRHTAELASVSK